ncbi:MAG TPA: MFS transporter [Syntrophomonadaceae bacterium]|nr:MFS transporter [Syntrophomonadaceae bacterium]
MKLAVKWQALIIVCLGIFMSTLDGSILNIANPTISDKLHVSMQEVQWVVTSYMLVITSSLLFFGKLGDRLGGHKIFTGGFFLFTLGSFFCSLAPSLVLLIAARCFQAAGASMLMATGIGIISNTFPGDERGKALGITGSVVGLGNMVGPSLGGFLVAYFSWPAIFLINVPIGIASFYLSYRYLAPQESCTGSTFYDLKGNLFFALSIIVLVLSVSLSAGVNVIYLALGLGLLAVFYLYERRIESPMLELDLFHNKFFTYGNLMGVATYSTQTAVFFLLPFYLQSLLNYSPASSGLFMTIPTICMAITAPLAGSLSDRIGPSRLTSIAFLLMTAGYLILSSLGPQRNLLAIISGLVLFGIGVASFGSPNTSSILGSISRSQAGYAGGFMATVRNFSFSLGIALSVSLFSHMLSSGQRVMSYAQSYTRALHWVYLSVAAVSFCALMLSVITSQVRQNHLADQ